MAMKLPSFGDLTPEQLIIINLPFDENWVVTGPPGTGKTILALFRAKELADREEDFKLMAFNVVLRDYAKSAFADEDSDLFLANLDLETAVNSYHQVVYRLWKNSGQPGFPPALPDSIHKDWKAMLPVLLEREPQTADHIIIDEGQDLPKDWYLFSRRTCSQITVFLDTNQTITSDIEHATAQQVKDFIESPKEYKVTQNHRNTKQIAKLSQHYFKGNPENLPTLPENKEGPIPEIVNRKDWKHSLEYIANYADTYPEQSIGIFAPFKGWAKTWSETLPFYLDSDRTIHLAVRGPNGENPEEADFDAIENGGILITTTATMKGLEFDAVFVLETDNPHYNNILQGPHGEQIFYVMITRARNTLEFHYSGAANDPPSIFNDVPSEILLRPLSENGTRSNYDEDEGDDPF